MHAFMRVLCCGVLLSGISACAGGGPTLSRAPNDAQPLIDYAVKNRASIPAAVKVGNPYTVLGQSYVPAYQPQYDEVGIASWYGPKFHGKLTANGERYNKYDYTAAHRTLPLPSIVQVTNLENGKQVMVRVNDRGPFAKDRVIDLSKSAAQAIDMIGAGTANVRVKLLHDETRQLWSRLDMKLPSELVQIPHTVPAQPVVEMPTSQTASVAQVQARELGAPAPVATSDRATLAMADIATPRRVDASAALASSAPFSPPTPRLTYVQAAAYTNRANAEAAAIKVAELGDAVLQPVKINGTVFYRVQLGPVKDASVLPILQRQLVDLGFKGAKMVAYE